MKILTALFALAATTGAFAQTAPVIGHPGRVTSVNPSVPTPGYLECLNGCSLGSPTPDAATLAVLQYADNNNIPGVVFSTGNQKKSADVCDVNYQAPALSVCRTYVSEVLTNGGQAPTQWQADTYYASPSQPAVYWTFLSWDLCMNYYPYGHGVQDKNNWPEVCGTYPVANSAPPVPGTDPALAALVNKFSSCYASVGGLSICFTAPIPPIDNPE